MPNANFAFGLAPTDAVAYLREKRLLSEKVNTKGLYDSALARATTIARLSSLEMTTDIYRSLEHAMQTGKPLNQWKKALLAEFQRKGWVAGHDKAVSRGIDGTLLADPKTGEYFGTPRRLNTIYRVNMQSAYSAARYQRLKANADKRPYWQYSAVGDTRTRPAHLALNGRIYRYDDPFWATFYPPNGFNCRCTVIGLSDRDLQRRGIEHVGSSSPSLVEVERPADKFGKREKTVGFKLPDGSLRLADKGFDYNVGRVTYRPNLDLYPEKLAHQFAKAEMQGGEFVHDFALFEREIGEIKQQLKLDKGQKLTAEQMVVVRNHLSKNFKFAAGRLTEQNKTLIGSNTATIWFSDDTLIKQFNSREGQNFGLDEYALLPEIFYSPDKILFKGKLEFLKEINGVKYFVAVKHLPDKNELFVVSFRHLGEKEWNKAFNDSR